MQELQSSAIQGDAAAQFGLGSMYQYEEGLQDDAEAVRWFKHSAQWGDVGAQTQLALQFMKGEGIPQNHVEAHKWSNLAAARSSAFESW